MSDILFLDCKEEEDDDGGDELMALEVEAQEGVLMLGRGAGGRKLEKWA